MIRGKLRAAVLWCAVACPAAALLSLAGLQVLRAAGLLDTPESRSAVFATTATIVASLIAAMAVVWQIGAQGRHALDQARRNEAMKLKVEIYRSVYDVCWRALDAAGDLALFASSFENQIASYEQMATANPGTTPPKARYLQLQAVVDRVSAAAVDVVLLTERWEIVDARLPLFRSAMSAAMHDVRAALARYTSVAIPLMPTPMATDSAAVHSWRPPSATKKQELSMLGAELAEALGFIETVATDFQAEMQNLLLGDLFEHRVPPRETIDPRYVAIRLDRHDELDAHFAGTNWGRWVSQSEADAHARQANREPRAQPKA